MNNVILEKWHIAPSRERSMSAMPASSVETAERLDYAKGILYQARVNSTTSWKMMLIFCV